MKTLKQFLIESREVVGNLPFSEQLFITFIKECFIDSKYDDAPVWSEMEQIITSKYNEVVWSGFKGWCEGFVVKNYPCTDDKIKSLYEALQMVPLSRLSKIKGAGSYGIVFDISEDKVLKFFYDKIERHDLNFYKKCLRHNYKTLPYVYKIGKNFVIMEKLKMDTPRLKMLSEYTNNWKTISGLKLIENDYKKLKKLSTDNLSEDEIFAIQWFIQLVKDLKSCGINSLGDFRYPNYGERKNGDIVYFDI